MGTITFVVNKQRLEMGIAIVFTGLMVLVVLPEGRQVFQPLVDVFDEAAFVVVDVDSGSNVHRGNQNHPFLDPALAYNVFHLRRQMDVCPMSFGVKLDVFGMNFHSMLPER